MLHRHNGHVLCSRSLCLVARTRSVWPLHGQSSRDISLEYYISVILSDRNRLGLRDSLLDLKLDASNLFAHARARCLARARIGWTFSRFQAQSNRNPIECDQLVIFSRNLLHNVYCSNRCFLLFSGSVHFTVGYVFFNA